MADTKTVTVRMPASLAAKVKVAAHDKRQSMNAYIVALLERAVKK